VSRRYDTVSFLTDFGTDDEFVGVVKAVIRDLAPHASVLDITHGIAPFDVRAGSLALARAIQYLPSGVVLAVVDPGVGTTRRGVAIEVAGGEGVLIGPDNGLLAPAVAMTGGAERAVVLSNSDFHLPSVATTFAGRDVFAPVAAALCNGAELGALGDVVDPNDLMPGLVPLSRSDGERITGEVLWVDRYGNCQLNIGPDEIDGWGERVRFSIDGTDRSAPLVTAFAQLSPASPGLLVDSSGLLALVFDQASASRELGISAGDAVILSRLAEDERTTPTSIAAPSTTAPLTTSVSLEPRR
jgi:S-adenosylmethionine hydrolase